MPGNTSLMISSSPLRPPAYIRQISCRQLFHVDHIAFHSYPRTLSVCLLKIPSTSLSFVLLHSQNDTESFRIHAALTVYFMWTQSMNTTGNNSPENIPTNLRHLYTYSLHPRYTGFAVVFAIDVIKDFTNLFLSQTFGVQGADKAFALFFLITEYGPIYGGESYCTCHVECGKSMYVHARMSDRNDSHCTCCLRCTTFFMKIFSALGYFWFHSIISIKSYIPFSFPNACISAHGKLFLYEIYKVYSFLDLFICL